MLTDAHRHLSAKISAMDDAICSEGIMPVELPSGIRKSESLFNSAISLFRFIPSDDDPRWAIASFHEDVKRDVQFNPIHFETALSAIYLSNSASFRNGYSAYCTEPNIRQLCRALQNLNAYAWLGPTFEYLAEQESPVQIQFARTNKITRGSNQEGVTGCPEALYQVRLLNSSNQYLGRIGFNVHLEGAETIFSISNVQGAFDGKARLAAAQDLLGRPIFNMLLQGVADILDKSGIQYSLRGLRNPPHIESAALYNTVFRKVGLKTWHFERSQNLGTTIQPTQISRL